MASATRLPSGCHWNSSSHESGGRRSIEQQSRNPLCPWQLCIRMLRTLQVQHTGFPGSRILSGTRHRPNQADPIRVDGCVQTVVLVVPAEGTLDTEGLEALAVLRAMGLPLLAALTPSALPSLQAKAAAKKHVTALLAPQVPGVPP